MNVFKTDRIAFTRFVDAKNYNSVVSKLNAMELDQMVTYAIWGLEICPTSQAFHFQGYVEFNSLISHWTIKRLLPEGSHWEPARAGSTTNSVYCKKSGFYHQYIK